MSEGILRGSREGVVTSTSALALAPAFAVCGAWLRDAEDLGVGVHLAAVGEDPPLLPAREIPTLVDRRGRLARSWRGFLAGASAGRVDPDDLRREFAAQIAAVRDLGVRITHLDSHQHLHLWPSVRSVVLDLARGHRIPAIRVPRSHRRGRPVAAGVNRLAADLARHVEAAGLAAPADAAGLDESGCLDAAGLVAALNGFRARSAPSAELGCHPGEAVDPDRGRYRWGFTWGAELALLVSPMTRRMIAERGFRLGPYDAL